jgi:hypothetical protein
MSKTYNVVPLSILTAVLPTVQQAIEHAEFNRVTWGDADATLLGWERFSTDFVAAFGYDPDMDNGEFCEFLERITAQQAVGVEYVDLQN